MERSKWRKRLGSWLRLQIAQLLAGLSGERIIETHSRTRPRKEGAVVFNVTTVTGTILDLETGRQREDILWATRRRCTNEAVLRQFSPDPG